MNEGFDDLASLFMSDIFHGHPAETAEETEPPVKRETHEQTPGYSNLVHTSASTDDFNDFLNNNTFINNLSDVQMPLQTGHHGSYGHIHYAGQTFLSYPGSIPTYATSTSHNHFQQHMPGLFSQPQGQQPLVQPLFMGYQIAGQMPQIQQAYELQQQQLRQTPHSMAASGGIGGSDLDAVFSTISFEGTPVPDLRQKSRRNENETQKQKPARAKSTLPSSAASSASNGMLPEARGKKESLGRPYLEPRIQIRYNQKKLTRLLDLKDTSPQNHYTIYDKNGSSVSVNFSCFLTGKLLTNDFDNSIYLLMAENADPTKKHDAKVISCYRRNLLLIAMNVKLSGFTTDEKLLRLQNSEYGYSVSRVIKWFKIQVLAVPSSDPNTSVPVLIRVPKDKDGLASKGDIVPTLINEPDHTVTLNNAEIKNGAIDNYFLVKQLQFRKATPYNGKLTLQNYFQLKVRLKAIVADLYYDDYIDEFSATSGDTDRNEILLHEVTSEPIIVRGRNPLFYEERNDILLGNRNPDVKNSFEALRAYKDDDNDDNDEDTSTNPVSNAVVSQESHSEEPGPLEEDEEEEDEAEAAREEPVEDAEEEPSREASVPRRLDSPDLKALSVDKGRYKYFPISSIYYLPPITSVYFPHGAHQKTGMVRGEPASDQEHPPQRRSSSNVYFK